MSANPREGRMLRVTGYVLKLIYRLLVRRAARQILQGRLLDPGQPEKGRWLRHDVDCFLRATWTRVSELLPQARLSRLSTYGSRHNVFLAVVTTAAYQVLRERGTPQEYAATLIADIGWKVYAWILSLAAAPFRIAARDPRKRMERTLRALMVFPFGAPGHPDYEVRTWSQEDRFFTHWTHCPPQSFVRDLIASKGDRGELDAFYRSWCLYDWAAADLLAGDGEYGHYDRPHTMSGGDTVCDMCWYARAPRGTGAAPAAGAAHIPLECSPRSRIGLEAGGHVSPQQQNTSETGATQSRKEDHP